MSSCRFPIIEPDPGHTKLRLSSEGLEAIKRIKNPIAAVAVSLIFYVSFLWSPTFFVKFILSALAYFNYIGFYQVIGPYRSGKSFLLNQLLSLSCYEGMIIFSSLSWYCTIYNLFGWQNLMLWSWYYTGFGVGHMRDTKTKGTHLDIHLSLIYGQIMHHPSEAFISIFTCLPFSNRY